MPLTSPWGKAFRADSRMGLPSKWITTGTSYCQWGWRALICSTSALSAVTESTGTSLVMTSSTVSAPRPRASDGRWGSRFSMMMESKKPTVMVFATKIATSADAHRGSNNSGSDVLSKTMITWAKDRIEPATKALAPTRAKRATNCSRLMFMVKAKCSEHTGKSTPPKIRPIRAPSTKAGATAPMGSGNASTSTVIANLSARQRDNVVSVPSTSRTETSTLSSSAWDLSRRSGTQWESSALASPTAATSSASRALGPRTALLGACASPLGPGAQDSDISGSRTELPDVPARATRPTSPTAVRWNARKRHPTRRR
mmetsp:Transcript_73002/g.225730  ORF Transcript_73002/g.225730 Transcript_73002/m.225730 type:complete len:314 (-) Transcript_73002:10-951(-)